MRSFTPPPCPKCGNPLPEKISQRRADLASGIFAKPPGSSKEIIYTFRCQCGVTFTHSIGAAQIEQLVAAERAALESMTPQELDREYERLLGKPPQEALSKDGLILAILVKLGRNFESP